MHRCAMIPALALLIVSGCDKTVPTPPGTTLLEGATPTRMSVTGWTVGAPKAPATSIAKTYRYTPGELGPDVRFKLAFEHAPCEFVTDKPKPDTPSTIDVPRAIRIEVVENTAWAMTARCDDDLKVPLAVNPDGSAAYPKSVWASCTLAMKRKNGDITTAPWIEIHGDGTLVVKPVGGDDERIVEE